MEKLPWYWDTIELKPSTELLSDEYEWQTAKDFMVQIIYGKDYKEGADCLEKTLSACGFMVKSNIFEDLTKILTKFKETIEKKRRKGGVFVIILCDGKRGDSEAGKLIDDKGEISKFADVWDGFIRMKCLDRVPKIFLFQTHIPQARIQFDGSAPKRLYDVAAPGADLFVICRAINQPKDDFIENFCNNISNHGEYADIFEIATFSIGIDRPLIVSTLTAKFFFKKVPHRQYNHQIMKGLKTIEDHITKK